MCVFFRKVVVVFLHVGFGNVIVEVVIFNRVHNAMNVLGNFFMVSSCIIEYIKMNTWVSTDICISCTDVIISCLLYTILFINLIQFFLHLTAHLKHQS